MVTGLVFKDSIRTHWNIKSSLLILLQNMLTLANMWQGNPWKTGDCSLSMSCDNNPPPPTSTIPHINERLQTYCCYNKHRLLSLYLIPVECVVMQLLIVTALHCYVLLTVSLHLSV
jgi:hypothetical protein